VVHISTLSILSHNFTLATYTMWANQHALILQDSGWHATHLQWGVNVTAPPETSGLSNWVHFPIPTPTIIAGQSVEATTAYVRLETGPQASITSITVYDGESPILIVNSDISGSLKTYTWEIPKVAISYGVGIDAQIKFSGIDPDQAFAGFVGAGVSFSVV